MCGFFFLLQLSFTNAKRLCTVEVEKLCINSQGSYYSSASVLK